MRIRLQPALPDDVPQLVLLKSAVSDQLAEQFGEGYWCSRPTENGIASQLRQGGVYVSRWRGGLLAALRLSKRKPWAIDRSFFSPSGLPFYLTDMMVCPRHQREGLGRQCVEEARRIAVAAGANAICLDAYDCPAGAGPFYAKCGFREVGRVVYRGASLIYFEKRL